MKEVKLLFALVLLCLHALGQQTPRQNNVSLSLFSLVSDNPGIEAGYERSYKTYWSSHVSLRVLTDAVRKVVPDGPEFAETDFSGLRMALEQRFHLRKGKRVSPYFSLTVAGMRANSTTSDDFRNGRDAYRDTFRLHKSTFIISPKFGLKFFFGERVFLDMGGGLGLKWRHIWHSGRKRPDDQPYDHFLEWIIFAPSYDEGYEFTVSGPADVRIGFLF